MAVPNSIKQGQHYSDVQFVNLSLQHSKCQNTHFENCVFTECDFTEADFSNSKFSECDFKSCNLSLLKINQTSFNEVSFLNSKLNGINWTTAKWPYIALSSTVYFNDCDLSYCNFFELKLSEFSATNCKVHHVDFRGTDLAHSDLSGSDFTESEFMHTSLKSADFRGAINYRIDPTANNIKKAQFSYPDAINLLNTFSIIVE